MLRTAWRSRLTGWQASAWRWCLLACPAPASAVRPHRSQDRSRKAAGRNAPLAWSWPCGCSRWNGQNGILWTVWSPVALHVRVWSPPPLGSYVLFRLLTWSLHTKAVNHCYLHDSPHNFSFNFIFFTSRNGVKCKFLALSFTSWDTWLCKFRVWPARAISTWFTVLSYLVFTETEEFNAF